MEPTLAARNLDQLFRLGMSWWEQLISMATADPTTCFTIRPRIKRQSGTWTTIWSLVPLTAPQCPVAGAWLHLESLLSFLLCDLHRALKPPLVLVRLDHVASRIVNANLSIMRTAAVH